MMQEECLAHFQLLQLQTPPQLLLTPAQNALCNKPSVAGTFSFPQEPFLREPTGRSFYNAIMQAIRCNDQIVTAAQYQQLWTHSTNGNRQIAEPNLHTFLIDFTFLHDAISSRRRPRSLARTQATATTKPESRQVEEDGSTMPRSHSCVLPACGLGQRPCIRDLSGCYVHTLSQIFKTNKYLNK